ncbi:hypothetical protein VA596_00570 [Amycolatopsis sp., V23-08]|uniref:Uncharacterized protein n=1 Tax=Amycolatopsis heterodermiae TaxID=3110235 RepID=A0ABU5QY06_9PSEU|nr:hypothetical protein [Amycolatopsis sp., V23-08]MEA5358011.1 hypothetical protein [Amycolatopsis sp., V23-08]
MNEFAYTTYIGTTPESSGKRRSSSNPSPFRRLSYTWHTFTPQWAKSAGVDDETLAKLRNESRSKG